jgi:tetratricopeptide (TPR) repeat protein
MSSFPIRKTLLGIAAAGSSYLVGAAFLDAVSNAISQINWAATITGTSVIFLLWLALQVFLKKHPVQWLSIRVTRLGYYPACTFIGIILLLWTPPVFNLFHSTSKKEEALPSVKATSKEAKIVVLLSDFSGISPESYGVTQIIFDQLTDATKGYQDVKIKRLYQNIDTSEVAQTKGRETQADIVLWGSYLVNQSQTRVTTHFDVIDKTFDIPLRGDKEILTAKTAKLESFTLQEQLSKEMSYLVLTTVGIIQVENLNLDDAISGFTKAISLSTAPEQIIEPQHLYSYRAISYLMKGKLDEAISDYTQAISYKRTADMFYMRGFALMLQDKSSQALNDFNISLSMEPSDQIYALRGYLYLFLINNSRLALTDFNKAIELNPSNIDAHLNRDILYLQQGDIDSAMADLNVVISLEPSSKAYNILGTAFEFKGDFNNAISEYSTAIEMDPENAAAYFNRGNLYSKHHYLDKALADADKAITLNPQFASPYNTQGNVYQEKGMTDEAILAYTKSIELHDDETYGDYYNRGTMYLKKGEFDLAIKDYDQSIKLNPQYASSYGNRCNTYLSKENFDHAISDCNQAIKLNPNESSFYSTRGAALAYKKKFALAIADFDKAIALDDKAIRAYFNRGNAYREQGNINEAISNFRKVVELGSDEGPVSAAKQNLCALKADNCQ